MSTRVTRSSQRSLNNSVQQKNETKSAGSMKRRQCKNLTSSTNEIEIEIKDSSDNETNEQNINVTPPKVRKSCEKENKLSPSTLLHRLSLKGDQEQNENQSNAVNVSESSRSKIDNARKVLTTAETDELYGRESELNQLTEFLSSNEKNKTSASIYISGQPGELLI